MLLIMIIGSIISNIISSIFGEIIIPKWIGYTILVVFAVLMEVFRHYILFVAPRKSPEGKQALLREKVKRASKSGK